MLKLKPPRVPEQPAPVLTQESLQRLLAVCARQALRGSP
jgi:hypothetical protein